LLQNRREVRHPVKAENRLHIGRRPGDSDRAFELTIPIRHSDQLRKVRPRGAAGNGDAIRLNAKFRGLRAQEADGRLDILRLRRKWRHPGKPIVHTRDGKSFRHEMSERHIRFRTRRPGATVNPDD
jgi:hypothetical protein